MSSNAKNEILYANPIASEIESNRAFRNWFVNQTPFAKHEILSVPKDEMLKMRSLTTRNSGNWCRSFVNANCDCVGCNKGVSKMSFRESDVFIILDTMGKLRLGIHIEIKAPGASFQPGQSDSYHSRAACWPEKSHKYILTHDHGCSVLICSNLDRARYRTEDVTPFDAVITFEEISAFYPDIDFPNNAATAA